MPTYDFHCRGCGNVVVLSVPFAQFDDDQFCDMCSGLLRRVISVPGVSFKGTGWGKDGK